MFCFSSSKTCTIVFIIICFCSFSNGIAQEKDGQLPVYLMEELVVTDSLRSVASEITVTRDMIRTRRPASAAEILAGVPGASVTTGSKNSSEIMIRGFTSRDVLVMVDGRPINETYYGKLDLSTLGAGNIEKIKIIKGATSVRYGPNAMGGVVNFITGEDTADTYSDVRMSAGSGKDFRTDVIYNGYANTIGYRIHAGRRSTAGFPLSSGFGRTALEDGDTRNNSDYRRTDLDAKLLFGPRENPRWKLNAGGSHLSKGLPSSVHEARYWRFRKWDRLSVSLDGEPVSTLSWKLKTKLYADRFLNELADYRTERYDISDVYWISTHDNRSTGLLVSSSYFPGDNGVSNFGLQVRWGESRRQADSGDGWFINRTATSWVFAEHERNIAPGLFLRGGLSGLFLSYDSWNSTASSLNPSLHIEWQVHGGTITGSVSRVSRFPTLHHLFSSTSGNPGLEPEWAYKGEFSISRMLLGTIEFSVTGFANRLHDMIYRSGRLNRYRNIDKASLDGIEISGSVRKKSMTLLSSITTLKAEDGEGNMLEYRPRWKADVYVSWQLLTTLGFSLTMRAVGERRTEIKSDLEPYHIENTGLIFDLSRSVSFTLNAENIFDADYEEEYGYPSKGRTLLAGFDWRWDKIPQ